MSILVTLSARAHHATVDVGARRTTPRPRESTTRYSTNVRAPCRTAAPSATRVKRLATVLVLGALQP